MLDISGLCIEFNTPNGVLEVVTKADLTVDPGEIVAIVGESGAGKSTIGNAVAGIIEPPGKITAGAMTFKERSLRGLSEKAYENIRGNEIAYVFQNPMTALDPLETIGRQITETPMAKLSLSRQAATHKAKQLLSQVGFSDPERVMASYPHELSGGMLQRAVIAIALSCDPSLIIADEPTTALDVSLQSEIISLLCSIAAERNIGVLLITHDMGVVQEAAHRIYIMRRGRIVESGAAEDILGAPQHAYTRNLIKSVPTNSGRNRRFYEPEASTKSNEKFAALFDATPAASKEQPSGDVAQDRIAVTDLSVTFASSRSLTGRAPKKVFHALKDVAFDIPHGSVFGIVGGSGSGKTTLARVIAGLQKPSSGEIDFGAPSNANRAAQPGPGIQMVFQNPYESLNPRHTIERQLTEAPIKARKARAADAHDRAGKLIEAVGLSKPDLKKFPHAFSGGQLQRISIARALSMDPSLLICDEPTSALDVTIQAAVLNLLKDLNERLGLTIIFISHDLAVCRHMCDRLIVMNNGMLCEEGDTLAVLDGPKHPFTQQLVNSAPAFRPPTDDSPQLQSDVATQTHRA